MASKLTAKSMPGGASRSRLIIGLLILALLLVLGLAWQASRTLQTNDATVTRLLQDYARLVTEEYSRRAMGEVGYYGYYTYINVLRQLALNDSSFPFDVPQAGADSAESKAARLAEYLFFVDLDGAAISFSADAPTGAGDFLLQRSSELASREFPETGFRIEHRATGGRSQTFVISRVGDSGRYFGFAVDRMELAARLRGAFDKDVLLPKALAGGTVTNEFIYLRFDDDSGNRLLETREDYDPYLLVTRTLGEEFEGIFRAHTISAAIDPVIAESLVIGGLPRSRLPYLLLVIILAVGLLIAAIRQLLRENALMKMRSDFVSEVSHELRTPLTQIRMFTETLLFERFQAAEDKQRALGIINREAQRLIHLVENVLRFSGRAGNQAELKLEDRELAPVIENVVEEFRPLASAAGAHLETQLERDIVVAVDGDALRQVMLNLLDNAIKYGPEGQTVRIILSRHPGIAEITVADQGPGIPRGEQERIWGGYYRLERERRSAIAGTGIGLAVVRELVAQHGGRTRVRDGEGACFVIELPAAGGETAPEGGLAAPGMVKGMS